MLDCRHIEVAPVQASAGCEARVGAYFGPQLEKSRTGVSINSTAGRPSGWALPRILVVQYVSIHRVLNGRSRSSEVDGL